MQGAVVTDESNSAAEINTIEPNLSEGAPIPEPAVHVMLWDDQSTENVSPRPNFGLPHYVECIRNDVVMQENGNPYPPDSTDAIVNGSENPIAICTDDHGLGQGVVVARLKEVASRRFPALTYAWQLRKLAEYEHDPELTNNNYVGTETITEQGDLRINAPNIAGKFLLTITLTAEEEIDIDIEDINGIITTQLMGVNNTTINRRTYIAQIVDQAEAELYERTVMVKRFNANEAHSNATSVNSGITSGTHLNYLIDRIREIKGKEARAAAYYTVQAEARVARIRTTIETERRNARAAAARIEALEAANEGQRPRGSKSMATMMEGARRAVSDANAAEAIALVEFETAETELETAIAREATAIACLADAEIETVARRSRLDGLEIIIEATTQSNSGISETGKVRPIAILPKDIADAQRVFVREAVALTAAEAKREEAITDYNAVIALMTKTASTSQRTIWRMEDAISVLKERDEQVKNAQVRFENARRKREEVRARLEAEALHDAVYTGSYCLPFRTGQGTGHPDRRRISQGFWGGQLINGEKVGSSHRGNRHTARSISAVQNAGAIDIGAYNHDVILFALYEGFVVHFGGTPGCGEYNGDTSCNRTVIRSMIEGNEYYIEYLHLIEGSSDHLPLNGIIEAGTPIGIVGGYGVNSQGQNDNYAYPAHLDIRIRSTYAYRCPKNNNGTVNNIESSNTVPSFEYSRYKNGFLDPLRFFDFDEKFNLGAYN